MRRPILLDNPPPLPLPSVRWSRFVQSRSFQKNALAAGGIAAVLGVSFALAIAMPYAVAPSAPSASSELRASVTVAQPAGAPGANGVQYVGDVTPADVKRADRPCGEQTWPYIAANCLKPASAQNAATSAPKVAVDRSQLKTVRVSLPSPVEPAAVEAPVAQPAQIAAAPAPEVTPPLSAVRPAPRHAARQDFRDDGQSKRTRAARAEPRDIRPDTRAEARRAYAAAPDRNTLPVFRPQPFHQAAAFSAER